MAYYLRQDKKKKGTYLQMYESYWGKEKKQPRSRNIESFGYVSDLISDEIPDPVSYYQKYVEKKNREHADSVADKTRPRAFTVQPEKSIHCLSTPLSWCSHFRRSGLRWMCFYRRIL